MPAAIERREFPEPASTLHNNQKTTTMSAILRAAQQVFWVPVKVISSISCFQVLASGAVRDNLVFTVP
jgi:hypothetical protein